jgi:hypothetical protein
VSGQLHRQDTHSGSDPRQNNPWQGQSVQALSKAETTGTGFTAAPTRSEPEVSMNVAVKPVRFAGIRSERGRRGTQRVSQVDLPPSEQISLRHRAKAAGKRSKIRCSEVLCWSQKNHGILWPSNRGIVMQPVAREPNHSVNLTRNSVPHWPDIARYAHNAMSGQCVTLSHAGYLKR